MKQEQLDQRYERIILSLPPLSSSATNATDTAIQKTIRRSQMPADSLEGMCTELLIQNAPKLTELLIQNAPKMGRALAEIMLASLSGGGTTAPLLRHPPSGVEHRGAAAPLSPPASTQKPRPVRQFDKRPGSAKENNEKILAAIAQKGSSLQDIVDKTKLPKKYVRSRINRLIRDAGEVRSEGKTSKARYFRV
jgi:hypothetical protein